MLAVRHLCYVDVYCVYYKTSVLYTFLCALFSAALREHNSGSESDRELFKGSKDVVSLLVVLVKKTFGWVMWIFL